MAWVTEYDLTWRGRDTSGDIFLQRDNGSYIGGLKLRRGSMEISNVLPEWEEQIVRSRCTFTIVNDGTNWHDLLPLMTISNGQIRVVVTQGGTNIFIGYLNPEAISQMMLWNSDLQLTASGLVNKLDQDWPISIDTIQSMSLIDMIDDCLLLTGAAYDIRVNMSIFESSASISSTITALNRTALFTELFWDNNVDRKSGLDIMKAILKSFNAYIYWFQGYWYIEHYEDLGESENAPYEKTYVEYTTGVSYTYASTGTARTISIGQPYDIHDPSNRPQIGSTQMLSVIPGLKRIEINKQQAEYKNLVDPAFTSITGTTDTTPEPNIRTWFYWDNVSLTWSPPLIRTYDIENGMTRGGNYYSGGLDYGNGLCTGFKITLQEDTVLTASWKWGCMNLGNIPGSSALEDYTIDCVWWIMVYYSGFPYVMVYNESAGTWDYTAGDPTDGLVTESFTGGDLDPALLTKDLSVTIPIGETFWSSLGPQDVYCVFGIGHERYDDGVITPQPGSNAVYGDLVIGITETPEDNVLRGTQNTDFLDEKTIDLSLFDSGWSYRNILLYGSAYQDRAEDWEYGDSAVHSLAEWLLLSKFRLYNVARQKILTKYFSIEQFRPLGLWLDNKQSDKTFVLFEDRYYPEENQHEVLLAEYDDSTIVNIL